MQSFFKRGQSDQQRPMWLRLVAMACLLVLYVASTAQVCHMHGALGGQPGKDSQNSRDSRDSKQAVPDNCPLCVAMHSALPATAHTAPEPVRQVQLVLPGTVQMQHMQRWSYELFSRPPPVISSQA
jgi:hypothetical protein